MVDKLVVQTHDTIKALAAESVARNNEINSATALIQDADNSKQLLTRLHDVILRREESGNPVDLKLRSVSQELHSVIVNFLQVNNKIFLFSSFLFRMETMKIVKSKCFQFLFLI